MNKSIASFSRIFLVILIVCELTQTAAVRVSAQSGLIVVIGSDTTWTKADSPHNLSAPLFVSEGATLTIEAGATVNLNGYEMLVNGTLAVIGSCSDKIQINNCPTMEFAQHSVGWNDQTGSGCVIENSILNDVNIVSSVSLKIDNSEIYGHVSVGESSMIMNSTINKISITGGSVLVKHNNITTISDCYGSPEISYNTIEAIGGSSGGNGGSPIISFNKIGSIGGYLNLGSRIEIKYLLVEEAIIANNTISRGIYLNGNPTITDNSITGYIFTWIYDVYLGVPGGPTERTGTFHTLGVDLQGGGYIARNNISDCDVGIKGGTVIEANRLRSNNLGIVINNHEIIIRNNNIIDGINGITVNEGDKSAIIENNFVSNQSNCGIHVTTQTAIQNNTISNTTTAIKLVNCPLASINYNNIANYSMNSIYLQDTSSNIDATNNWWGTTDAQAINQTIYDFKYDFYLGKLNFVPFFTEPNPEAMPTENPEIPEFPSLITLPLVLTGITVVILWGKQLKRTR